MKLSTPEIVWHGKEPVFSADFHRNGATWRLATGGADHDVKVGGSDLIVIWFAGRLMYVWHRIEDILKTLMSLQIWKVVRGEDRSSEKMRIIFLANLSSHTKAVNVVRFSPNGTSVLK